jgi:glycosyltransferase involved in cell wall biosynthesis
MKICLGITRLKKDLTEAISKNFYNLSEELAKDNNVTILSPITIEAKTKSNTIIYSKDHSYENKKMVLTNIKKLCNFINENHEKFDVIHIHAGFLLEAYLIDKALKKINTPIYITIWQPYLGHKEFMKNFKFVLTKPKDYLYHFTLNSFLISKFYTKKIKNRYRRIIVSSEYQKKQLKNLPVQTIPNGLKNHNIRNKIEETNHPKIIYIGHFTHFKGIDSLLESIKYAKMKYPEIKLTLAWSGYGSNNNILKKINKLNLKENIIFRRKIEVYKELAKNDFLIVPYQSTVGTSHYHNVLLEAMSTGTPILASKIGSIPGIIMDERTGIFINPSKPKNIAKKITRFFENKELREKISKNSLSLFEKRFLVKNVAKQHLNLYNEKS